MINIYPFDLLLDVSSSTKRVQYMFEQSFVDLKRAKLFRVKFFMIAQQ